MRLWSLFGGTSSAISAIVEIGMSNENDHVVLRDWRKKNG